MTSLSIDRGPCMFCTANSIRPLTATDATATAYESAIMFVCVRRESPRVIANNLDIT